MLWILRTGAPWPDLPARYPPFQSVHRRLQEWVDNGTFERILTALADDLLERGQLDVSECFIDGTFVVAKKGGLAWERPSGAKVRKSWQVQTALVFLSPSTVALLRHMNTIFALFTFKPKFTRNRIKAYPFPGVFAFDKHEFLHVF
jgi:hypothetical protein